jgi:PKD repeat protein
MQLVSDSILKFTFVKMKPYLILICLALSIASCKKDKEEERKQAFVDFTYSGNIGYAPVTVHFVSTPTAAGTVEWDFGDGSTGSGINVSHAYDSAGFYTVGCTLNASSGQSHKTKKINVSPYTSLSIYRIDGIAAATKPGGATWDTGFQDTDPDLFFRVYSSSGTQLTPETGNPFIPDVFNIQYPVIPDILISDFENPFTVKFLDYDPAATADDVIGIFSFTPGDYFSPTGNFTASLSKSDANGTSITVRVIWNN